MGDTDVIHRFGRDMDWNESFYFNFYDRDNGICAFMRVSLEPNHFQKTMFCYLMMPDGNLIGIRRASSFKDTELNAGGLVFQKIVPERRWKLMFNGGLYGMNEEGHPLKRISFMLDWNGLGEVFDYRDCLSGREEERMPPDHLEQFGKVTGLLECGGRRYQINALGERNHLWGVSDRIAPRSRIWLAGQFSEVRALNVMKMVVEGEEIDTGFIHLAGRNIPITEARIETHYGEGGVPKSMEMGLKDAEGADHLIDAVFIREAIMEFPRPEGNGISLMQETLVRYRMDDMEGYGMAEFLIRERPDPIRILDLP